MQDRIVARVASRAAFAAVSTVLGICLAAAGAGAQSCTGDCDGSGAVTVDELIIGVDMAIDTGAGAGGGTGPADCAAFDPDDDDQVATHELVTGVGNALAGCPPLLTFSTPNEGFLLLAGTVAVTIDLPDGTDPGSLSVDLDGVNVSDEFSPGSASATAALAVGEGEHVLTASARTNGRATQGTVHFEAVALADPDECEVLNNAECFLPFPSSRFLVPAPAGAGNPFRVALPQIGVPVLNGPEVPIDPVNELDGFSPTVQILTHFPQGVDPERSNASRLLPPSDPGPPWIDTRTYDGRSLEADSPTVLLDTDTGERVLHFVENDGHAVGNLPRQSFILRPALSLVPGHHYVVAMRNLKTAEGWDVVAERAFAALRDNRPTSIAAIENRRQAMEDGVFAPLAEAGVERDDLVLAFDFVVQSEYQLTHQMLSMRDQAYAWLDEVADQPGLVTFSVAATINHDCDAPGQVVWRDVSGTYQAPLFLDGNPDEPGVQFLNVDANDVPVQNGFMQAPFDISIPCSVLEEEDALETYPIILGHGLFGTGTQMTRGIPGAAALVIGDDWKYIAGATLWRGLSSPDVSWLINDVIGVGETKLFNFPALPDRLKQGMLNTLVLARMMKLGLFNLDATFRLDGGAGAGVFAGPERDMFYYGISLGGIMGTWMSALTPDIQHFGLDVPGINFSCLLQRSTQFGQFETLLRTSGLTDPMETILGLQLQHEIWVSGEPAGYARHITSDPLPGSGTAKNILMTPAWLDKQVSNQCTEIAARTLRLSNLVPGSLQRGLQDIPDEEGPLDSAYVMYDTGSFDLFNEAHQQFIPPLSNLIPSSKCDPHGARPFIPASVVQIFDFLQPGGKIENQCDGLCDAGIPFEIRVGDNPMPCDPLAN